MNVNDLLTFFGLIFAGIGSWIGFSLKDIRSSVKEMKEKFDEFTAVTEHRLTTVETRQKTSAWQMGEMWRKCFGITKQPLKCDGNEDG